MRKRHQGLWVATTAGFFAVLMLGFVTGCGNPSDQTSEPEAVTTTATTQKAKESKFSTTETPPPPSNPKFTEGWKPFSSKEGRRLKFRVKPAQSVEILLDELSPSKGDFAGFSRTFETQPGAKYEISAVVYDAYPNHHPRRLENRLYVGDKLIWQYDLGKKQVVYYFPLKLSFKAESEKTEIKFEIHTVGDPEPSWHWGIVPLRITDFNLEKVSK